MARTKLYRQHFVLLTPRRKPQDDGVTYTIFVPATNPKQAERRIKLALYGNGAIPTSKVTVLPQKPIRKACGVAEDDGRTHFVGDSCPGGLRCAQRRLPKRTNAIAGQSKNGLL